MPAKAPQLATLTLLAFVLALQRKAVQVYLHLHTQLRRWLLLCSASLAASVARMCSMREIGRRSWRCSHSNPLQRSPPAVQYTCTFYRVGGLYPAQHSWQRI